MEERLWDEEGGYYVSWWELGLDGAPDERSPNSQVSQLTGAWWADLLGIPQIVDGSRRRRALQAIYRMNVEPVSGCPADEAAPDGTTLQSMAALVVPHYGAQAIAAGLPDQGWEAVRRIYRVRYELDRSPWDAPLQWSGPGNEEPQWGRWYMSNPSSWYLPLALAGIRVDRLRGRLSVAPSWPSAWGEELDMPVFLPDVQLRVRAGRGSRGPEVRLEVERITRGPIVFDEVSVRLPGTSSDTPPVTDTSPVTDAPPVTVTNGRGAASWTADGAGRMRLAGPLVLRAVGEGFRVRGA
jgi:hypothetical protein